MKLKRNRIVEYDMLRLICTLLIVFSWASFGKVSTVYGGVDYINFLGRNSYSMFYKNVSFFSEIIYDFCPSLCMALSGGLFYRMCKKKKQTFGVLLISKARRLLIPFVIVSCLYVLPLKWFGGYYSDSENWLYDFLMGQILLQGNTHLWYLAALFFIFAGIYLLEKLIKNKSGGKLLFLWILSWLSLLMPVVLIRLIMRYSLWFYTGYCFEKHRTVFNSLLKRYHILGFGCMFVLLFRIDGFVSCNTDMLSVFIHMILHMVCILTWCCTVYGISFYLSRSKIAGNQIFEILSENSFGIYLYSEPLNYVILSIAVSAAGNRVFVSDIYALLLFISRFFIMLIVSLQTSAQLRKRIMRKRNKSTGGILQFLI